MEFTQICSTIWRRRVHNTMCTLICSIIRCVHVSAVHFHNGFFGHGDAAILKPHMWRHEQTICQIRCKVKQLELGQEAFRLHLYTWTIKWDELGPFLHLFRRAGAISEILKAWSLFSFFCHSPADVWEAFSILLVVWYWLDTRFLTFYIKCLFHKICCKRKGPNPKRLVPVGISYEALSPTS